MLTDDIARHLRFLVEEAGHRPPGSPANRRAVEHARKVLSAAGFTLRESVFTTRWWEPGPGRIEVLARPDGGRAAEHGAARPPEISRTIEVSPNPYSPACDLTGVVHTVSRLDRLTGSALGPGDVLVLRGPLVGGQIVPIGYPFYAIEEHTALMTAILAVRPAAIIAVSDHWAPVFEDAALPVPSTTVPTALAGSLTDGTEIRLVLGGRIHDARGVNLAAWHRPAAGNGTRPAAEESAHATQAREVALTGEATQTGGRPAPGERIVVSAHLDSKVTTPGAFDNAASVAVLLGAAENGLLTGSSGAPPVEVVLFNGEDHFDACGEMAWLADTDLGEVRADVNIDGAGVAGRSTQISAMSCPPEVERAVVAFAGGSAGWEVAEPWPESDHSIFAMRGIPAVAITSHHVHDLLSSIAHTERDDMEMVDVATLAAIAEDLPRLLADLWRSLDQAGDRVPA